MKIETITVKLLRSGESYTNDSTEIRVALDDGDDWEATERDLRKRAERLIEQHWREKDKAEEAEELRQAEELEKRNADLLAKRDAYLAAAGDDADCSVCPVGGEACYGCERGQPF